MSRITRMVKGSRWVEKTEAEVNCKGGISYRVNPIDTLKKEVVFADAMIRLRDGIESKKNRNIGQ